MRVLILDSTKKIQVVMSGAAATTNPDYTAHYADSTTTAFTELSSDGTLNGTTPVDVVAAPAANTNRIIRAMTVQNRDTAAVTITVSLVSAGGTRQIFSGTLTVGDTWTLEGTYSATGNLKTGGYTHPNHSGDVTSVGDGVTTIGALKVATSMVQADAITYDKIQNVASDDVLLGRISGAVGNIEEVTPAQIRTLINVADGANAYVHPNHSGDVTSVADGATTIGALKVATGMIQANAVTNAKQAQMTALTMKGNDTVGASDPLDLTVAQVNTLLGDELTANKDATSGYAGLDSNSRVTAKLLPSGQSTSANSAPIKLTTSASHLTTPEIGAVEFLNSILEFTVNATVKRGLIPVTHIYRNNSSVTMPNSATATNIFTVGTVAIVAGTTYEFEMFFQHLNTNVTSHTEGFVFALAGGASVTDFLYRMQKTINTTTATGVNTIWGTVATITVLTPSITASSNGIFLVKGTFRCNAGGTIAPQFKYSAAPGGTGTIGAGAYIKLTPLGLASADINIGAWA